MFKMPLSKSWIAIYLLSLPFQVFGLTATTEIQSFLHQVWDANHTIQSAEANVKFAEANAEAASRPLYNPELELEGEYLPNDKEDNIYTIGLTQTIDLFNKRSARSQVGQSALTEAKAVLETQRLSLGISALTALSDYNAARHIVALAQKRTELLQRFVTLTEKRYAAGDLGQAALDQSYLVLSEAIVKESDAKVSRIQAQEALMAITNLPLETWPALPADLPRPPNLPNDFTSLIRQQPALKTLDYKLNTAYARVKVAQKNTRPSPTINIRGGQEGSAALMGASLSIPLFVRNNFHSEVNAANEEAIVIEEARLALYQQIKAKLEGAVSRYTIRYQANKQWGNISAGSLDEGINLLDKLWESREINTIDYLILLTQRIDNQIAGIRLQNQTWENWFQWLDASNNLDNWLGNDAYLLN